MSCFPAWMYSPDGSSAGIFECAAEVPEGWVDAPCKAHRANKLAEAVEAINDAAAQIAKMDGDGDGRIGGSLPKGKRQNRKR